MKSILLLILCLMLVFSIWATANAENIETPLPGIGGLSYTIDMMFQFFSEMSSQQDLEETFRLLAEVEDVYQELTYSQYYNRIVYILGFHDAWTALQNDDYESAYGYFDDLRNNSWGGDNAESIENQVNSLRKYTRAMYQLQSNSYSEALITFEDIDMDTILIPSLANEIRTNIKSCASAIREEANTAWSEAESVPTVAAYQKALDLYQLLAEGESFLDTETQIAKCEVKVQELSQPQADAPIILMSDLVCTQTNLTELTIKWQCTIEGTEVSVTYAPQGIVKDVATILTMDTEITLRDLFPTTAYDIVIAAQESDIEPLKGTFSTASPGIFTAYSLKYPTVSLYSYSLEQERVYGLQTIVETDEIEKVDTNVISLPRFNISNGETGYVVLASFMCDQTENDKELTCRGVMRVPNAGTYQEYYTAVVDGSRVLVSLYIPLNNMLSSLFDELGGWEEEAIMLDVFFNDQFFGQIAMTLEP